MSELHLHADDPDVELLARRALGRALSVFWNSPDGAADIEPMEGVDADQARSAAVVIMNRVPTGPERDLALDILRHSTEPPLTP